MKTLYFDCFSGISGDMAVGALIDLGVDFDFLKSEISRLPLEGFELRCSRVSRASVGAVKFDVAVEGDFDAGAGHVHPHGADHAHGPDAVDEAGGTGAPRHRRAADIIAMIRGSGLNERARDRAVRIFEKLALAEAQVHRIAPAEVEFHEVGAVDSIVDVVGTAVGLEALEVERFVCLPVNVGGGFINCRHGVYPVPAPATANLLARAPVYSRHVEGELVTPTGAAILSGTVDRFGPMEDFEIERVGYGAGTKDFGRFPNCLRLFLGREPAGGARIDEVVVIEANIDDMSAEALAYAGEILRSAGALDVTVLPALMKKGRPGHLLQVLAASGRQEDLARLMLEETTTIGVRMYPASRRILDREVVDVDTAFGAIRVKLARLDGRVVRVSPEYDDCARRARETGRPFHDIHEAAVRRFHQTAARTGSTEEGTDDGNG